MTLSSLNTQSSSAHGFELCRLWPVAGNFIEICIRRDIEKLFFGWTAKLVALQWPESQVGSCKSGGVGGSFLPPRRIPGLGPVLYCLDGLEFPLPRNPNARWWVLMLFCTAISQFLVIATNFYSILHFRMWSATIDDNVGSSESLCIMKLLPKGDP